MSERMDETDLTQARAWAETIDNYPIKQGYLTLLNEIDKLRADLRREREDHAATWKRAGENGQQLIDLRARIAEGVKRTDPCPGT